MNRSQLSLLSLALVAAPALVAQDATGQVVGSVKTKGGQPVAGAQVRFASPAMQGSRVLTTDAAGNYRAPLLPPGRYQITVTKEGFVAPKVEAEVGLGQIVRQDLLMDQVGSQAATVEVIATATSVDKSDVKSATVVSAEFMDAIPRATRGMDTAALLTPGVATGVGNRVQIRGAQSTQNRFLLNGTDIADNVFGDTTGRGYYVDDSVQETQVIQSPVHARYGGFTGGVVNAITKTGSNEFSGILRTNFSRAAAWSAQSPRGMRPNILPGNAGTGLLEDAFGRETTLWVGGPIVKDYLWLAVSTKLYPVSASPQNFSSVLGLSTYDGAPAYIDGNNGGPFTRTDKTTFYEGKLTFSPWSGHTFEYTANKNKVEQVNRFYVLSFDPNTLVPQTNENEYWTLAYRGVFGSSWTAEARYAKKHQLLSAGGDPAKGDPVRAAYSNGSYYIFNNGIFDKTDGGDNRDIETMTGNVTWFSAETSWGQVTMDVGFEVTTQERAAANAQSPTGRQFFVWGRNADGTYRASAATPLARSINQVGLYSVDKGTAITQISATYLNFLWTLNKHWQFNLGGRMDKSTAEDTLGSETISSSRFTPRFQATWDIFGDQSWLLRGSEAYYAGKLNDGFTNRFTRAGNPISEWFRYGSTPTTTATLAQVTNLANWDVTLAGLVDYGGPLNRFADNATKAPYTHETSLGLRRSFKDGSFFALTYNVRKGKGYFNDFFSIGDEVAVPLIYVTGTQRVRAERWATDANLKRDYKGLEMEFLFRMSPKWDFGGNYTYAVLKGNSEGSEGNNPAVIGDVIGNYDSVHTSRGRGSDYYAPYGYLTGDVTHRARMYVSFTDRDPKGAGFYGSLLFNLTGGSPYSLTRGLAFEAQTDATTAGSTIVGQYPSTYTRYYGPRGLGRFNDTFGFDLKLGVDVPLFWRMRWFGEVTVINVFNHWQLATYSTVNTTGTTLATTSPLAGYRANPLALSGGNYSGYGTYGNGDFVGGRSVVLSTGLKW